MITLAKRLLRPFGRYLKDERASVTVEVVMVLPIMLWGYFGMFVLFDGYRALSANIRTGYTISDMISRQSTINQAALEGLNDIQDVLTQSHHRTVLRVTAVRYRDLDNDGLVDPGEHILEWSHSTAGKSPLTQADLPTAVVPVMPSMADTSVLIVVETFMAFVPFVNLTQEQLICNYIDDCDVDRIVFGPFYFETIVVTRPRFANQLIWKNS